MQLEIICGGCITCIQVYPNTSLRTVLRQTRYSANDSHLLLLQIGGKCVGIEQVLAESVDENKAKIQLYIYFKCNAGMRKPADSCVFQAPEQPSVASTQRTLVNHPAAVESTNDTAMDDRPEQAVGMNQNIWDFFLSVPQQPSVASQAQTQRTSENQLAAVESTDDTAIDNRDEQAVGMRQTKWDFFFSLPEQQRERQVEPSQEVSQEIIAEFLGVVPRNGKEQKAKTKAGEQKGTKTKKPKQNATPKVFKWDPRLIFKDGNTLLSTGSNSPVSKLGT